MLRATRSTYPLNPRALQSLRLIVEKGSLADAARTVHLSPPAASRLLPQLERRLDIELFSREQPRPWLAPDGEAFFREASPVVDALETLPEIARGIRDHLAADLRVVTSAPPGIGWVIPAILRPGETHRGMKVLIDLRSRFEFESRYALETTSSLMSLALRRDRIGPTFADPIFFNAGTSVSRMRTSVSRTRRAASSARPGVARAPRRHCPSRKLFSLSARDG